MAKLSRKEFEWILELQKRQGTMLRGQDIALSELYRFCDTDDQRFLIFDLLKRFNWFNEELCFMALDGIVNYIQSLNYNVDEILLVAFSHDHETDSSQELLYLLELPLSLASSKKVQTLTRFDHIQRICKKSNNSIRHIIAIDEFIGSGKTLFNHYSDYQKLNLSKLTIDFCFLAGMSDAIKLARSQGISIHVEYIMERGISDYYKGPELSLYYKEMQRLENKLASIIDETKLEDYNFGYGKSESLYFRSNHNIPNNVFPVFWWKKLRDNTIRHQLFNRVQNGY